MGFEHGSGGVQYFTETYGLLEKVTTIEPADNKCSEARASLGAFLGKVYNQKRLHSALGYLPPAEFERGLLPQTNTVLVALKAKRNSKIRNFDN